MHTLLDRHGDKAEATKASRPIGQRTRNVAVVAHGCKKSSGGRLLDFGQSGRSDGSGSQRVSHRRKVDTQVGGVSLFTAKRTSSNRLSEFEVFTTQVKNFG
jgi:hypothetical protein